MFKKALRAYLNHFPIQRGKWRIWKTIEPHLPSECFKEGDYRIRHGVTLHLAPVRYIEKFLYFWGIWEADETTVLMRLLKEGDVFIDIGANIGFYTLLASRIVGEKGRVHAFEPIPDTLDRLRRNTLLNRAGNVSIHDCAATNEHTTIKIAKPKNIAAFEMISLRARVPDDQNFWEVRGSRVEDEVSPEQPVKLIKIDVEGAELLALRGLGKHLLGEQAPMIFCEVTDSFLRELGGSANELFSFMREQGYCHAYQFHKKQLIKIPFDLPTPPPFQINVLFAKSPVSI